MKTKVLILHTAVGHGIKITAQNIFDELQGSGDYDVRIEDVGKVENGLFAKTLAKTYLAVLEKFSPLWGFLYNSKIVLWIMLPLRKVIASFKSKRTLAILREFQPAIVVSTQAISTGIISYLKAKGLYRGKLAVAFSDYHLHRFWLFNEVDLYICSIPEQVTELKSLGITPDKLILTGMIVAEKYLKPIPKDQACLSTGLLTSMPTVLISGGMRGVLVSKEIFKSLIRSPKSYQVAVVCGKNLELKAELEKISAPSRHPVKIFGFIDNQDVLMSAADVLVSKPGGPTIAEGVSKRLPVIITDAHPGHEQANMEYLVRNNIVSYGRIPREVVFLVEKILSGNVRERAEVNFGKLIRPPGSHSVLEAIDLIKPQPKPAIVKSYLEG